MLTISMVNLFFLALLLKIEPFFINHFAPLEAFAFHGWQTELIIHLVIDGPRFGVIKHPTWTGAKKTIFIRNTLQNFVNKAMKRRWFD